MLKNLSGHCSTILRVGLRWGWGPKLPMMDPPFRTQPKPINWFLKLGEVLFSNEI